MNKATKLESGRYDYRGFTIYRDDSITAGKYGSWKYSYPMRRGCAHSLKEAKQRVDALQSDS